MWRKIMLLILTACFLMAASTPVFAHNGRIVIPNVEDPDKDEHPWGGENVGDGGPGSSVYQFPDDFDDKSSFIKTLWDGVIYYIVPYLVRPRVIDNSNTQTQQFESGELNTSMTVNNPNVNH